jgi:hypothetical protein
MVVGHTMKSSPSINWALWYSILPGSVVLTNGRLYTIMCADNLFCLQKRDQMATQR